MSSIFEQLRAPFPPHLVSWRIGSKSKDGSKGMALAYIDARDVMNRLDGVCGAPGWQDRYEVHGPKTICYLSIRSFEGEWVTKADGAGDTDVEAEKGSLSDAFKRAAVKWGIGRYLYDIEAPWVALEGEGRFAKIKQSELVRLQKLLPGSRIENASAPVEEIDESIRTYFEMAKAAIKTAKFKQDLREWWKAESGRRRALDLTEAQIADLASFMKAAADRLPESTLGAA